MLPPEVTKRIGVGVLIIAVIVAGSVVVTAGSDSGSPEFDSMNYAAYSGDDTVASAPSASGEIELSADARGEVILIDASHGNAIDREQLTPLVEALTRNGAEVRFLSEATQLQGGPGQGSAFNASLRQADAFITFGPQRAYSESEIAGLSAFADAGGRVLIANEPAQMQTGLIIIGPRPPQGSAAVPLTSLASEFGVSYGNGYLYNMHRYDTNYRNIYASPVGNGPLTSGVDEVVLHEATPVYGPTAVMTTSERTELSETREQSRYNVVVRSGNVVAIGDSSVLGQEYYQRADNEVFVSNLLDFLVSGQKIPANAPTPTTPEAGSPGSQPPR